MPFVAGKSGNVLDQYRCGQIYDAIDTGNNRLAIAKADQLIKTATPSPLAKVLKCIALVRLGEYKEAGELSDEILKGRIDMSMLYPLKFVLPRLDRTTQLAELLMEASQAHANDPELAEDAVKAMVRAKMFQRAGQELMRRLRTDKSPRNFWRYLQVAILLSKQLEPPGSRLALQVAERLMNDQEIDDTSFNEETLWLYLFFHMQLGKGKVQPAIEIFDKTHPKHLLNNSLALQFLYREGCELSGNFARILDDCKARINAGDRNWAVYTSFIHAAFVLQSEQANKTLEPDVYEAIVRAAEQDKWSDRGSFLGVLELLRRAAISSIATEPLLQHLGKDNAALVCDFYGRFCSKPSCFEDLLPYAKGLDRNGRDALLARAASQKTNLETIDAIQKYINAEKLEALLRPPKSPEQATEKSQQHMLAYVESLKHVRLPDTEMQPGDDLALLAAYSLLEQKGTDADVDAAVIAAYGCSQSRRGYRLRLLLMRLLQRLGCLKAATEHFGSLGVRAIQYDTLSHYILSRTSAFGGTQTLAFEEDLHIQMEDFFQSSKYEIPECTCTAFSNGKFSQVTELNEFDSQVQRSTSRAIAQIDFVRSELIREDLTAEKFSALKDNVSCLLSLLQQKPFHDHQDHSLLPSYTSKGKSLDEMTQLGPMRKSTWIACMLEPLSLVFDLPAPEEQASLDELTKAEQTYIHFMRSVRVQLDSKSISEPDAVSSFVQTILGEISRAPDFFSAVHAAWLVIEAYRIIKTLADSSKATETLPALKDKLQARLQDVLVAVKDCGATKSRPELSSFAASDCFQQVPDIPGIAKSLLAIVTTEQKEQLAQLELRFKN